jgi:hypothetical protein
LEWMIEQELKAAGVLTNTKPATFAGMPLLQPQQQQNIYSQQAPRTAALLPRVMPAAMPTAAAHGVPFAPPPPAAARPDCMQFGARLQRLCVQFGMSAAVNGCAAGAAGTNAAAGYSSRAGPLLC